MPAADSASPTIATIVADPDDPNIRRVRVGRRVVAELLAHDVEAMKLVPGRAWTPALEARVARVQAHADVRRDALRMLARTGMASSRLRERLEKRKHDAAVVAEVVAALVRDGWLDDEGFAESAVASLQRRGALPAKTVAARLASRGVDEAIAAGVAKRRGAQDESVACLAAAKKLVKSPSTGAGGRRLDKLRVARRAAAALARRGFDPDTIDTTLRTIGFELGSDE